MAAVIDPQRDVGIYLETAAQHGLHIQHIIETHLHADFVSGHQELAERTGATIYLGEGSGATFPHRAVRDGDVSQFGKCRLQFLQTPGHTLESVSIVVTDLEQARAGRRADRRHDVYRRRRTAGPLDTHTPQELAGLLYDSLHRKLLTLPDAVQVYPAHGAGSMCGRNISSDRSSTIGRERSSNYALRPMAREAIRGDDDPRSAGAARILRPRRGREPPRRAGVGRSASAARPRPGGGDAEAAGRREWFSIRVAAAPYVSGPCPRLDSDRAGRPVRRWAGSLFGLDRDIIVVAEDGQEEESAHAARARGNRSSGGISRGRHRRWASSRTAAGPDETNRRAGSERGTDRSGSWMSAASGSGRPGHIDRRGAQSAGRLKSQVVARSTGRPAGSSLQERLSQPDCLQPVGGQWLHECDECAGRLRRVGRCGSAGSEGGNGLGIAEAYEKDA